MAVQLSQQSLLETPSKKKQKHPFLFLTLLSLAPLLGFTANHLFKTPPADSPFTYYDLAHGRSFCTAMVTELISSSDARAKSMFSSDLLHHFLTRLATNIQKMIFAAKLHSQNAGNLSKGAMQDCLELLEYSVEKIVDSMEFLARGLDFWDAHVWLSSVLTSFDTCLDGFNGTRSIVESEMEDLIARGRVVFALLVSGSSSHVTKVDGAGWPSWITPRDIALLEIDPQDVEADVVVVKHGSGNFMTVTEAVASAPEKFEKRYVNYVKKGVYKENVEVGNKRKNLMFVGDGINSTVGSSQVDQPRLGLRKNSTVGRWNVVDGSTTFRCSTMAVVRDKVVAQDLCIQNTAGVEMHQAMALRLGEEKSLIHRCPIDRYQYTLYAHMNRNLFTKCYITGTVDFIFGNVSVVLQICKLVAQKSMANQSNMVTAQGRIDPNQNIATSIQNCDIVASEDLELAKKSVKMSLGCPWKEYSRTVVSESYIGDLVDALGWAEWSGDFGLKTLYYGEYKSYGEGSNVTKRVKWAGYHVILSAAKARMFTVRELIQGDVWLNATGVP